MATPTWDDFDVVEVPEFRPRAPHVELADVLRRYRADLDSVARSAADRHEQRLRALAEQAVLAVKLDRLLGTPSQGEPFAELRELADRMLEEIDSAGLEIVRLAGASADDVAGLVEVEHWRFAETYERAIVAEELEVAICANGRALRLGRVVMGAPPGHVVAHPLELRAGARRHVQPPDRQAKTTPMPDPVRIVCPVEECGAENAADADVCVGCLTTIAGYRRLSLYPELLLSRGLRAARAGHTQAARDCFAAVTLWQPEDVRARNAHALACADAQDLEAADRSWRGVLALAPDDPLALRGLAALAAR
jgi:hypothetical protein